MRKAPNGRNSYIDALRGLSILAVIFLHFTLIFRIEFALVPRAAVTYLARNGYYGVTMFFVISGFLITSHTIKKYGSIAQIRPELFYLARVARIAPLLVIVTIAMTVLHLINVTIFVASPNLSIWVALWTALTFQFNWYYVAGANTGLLPWGPLWSLSIEELFYVLFPVACLALRKPALIAGVLIVLVIQAPFVRSGLGNIYFWSGCADAIAMGCMAALLVNAAAFSIKPWLGLWLRWLGLAIIGWRYFFFAVTADFSCGPSFIALGAAIYLVGSTGARRGPAALLPLQFMGRRSYEIYLIHMPVILVAKSSFGGLVAIPEAAFVLILTVVVTLGAVIGRCFTDPMERLIRRDAGVFMQRA